MLPPELRDEPLLGKLYGTRYEHLKGAPLPPELTKVPDSPRYILRISGAAVLEASEDAQQRAKLGEKIRVE